MGTGRHPAAAPQEKATGREPRAVVRQEKDTSRERRAAAPQEKGTVTEQSAVALQEKGTVMGQSAAVLSGTELTMRTYLADKAAHAAVSVLLAWTVSMCM